MTKFLVNENCIYDDHLGLVYEYIELPVSDIEIYQLSHVMDEFNADEWKRTHLTKSVVVRNVSNEKGISSFIVSGYTNAAKNLFAQMKNEILNPK
jgi:hypothetical protein